MGIRRDDALPLVNSILEGIFEKQGENIVKIDLRALDNAVCSYFVICHARSTTQVDSIAEAVEFRVKKNTGEKPDHIEGVENCLWVLMDYGNVVIHIFQEEQRNFYRLEELWADGEIEFVEDKNK
ncbi:MAG: ribosome silencing factor [Bacteroidia bacterium]|nr:MAG: ribosome silencing factor [Bacteroidia bacterium]